MNQFAEETSLVKMVNTKSSLTSKKDIKLKSKEKAFKCDCCDQRFSYSSYLNRHLQIHTGEKPFQCDLCYKRFSHRVNLNVHLRIHAGEQPFQCDWCGQRFIQKANLKSPFLEKRWPHQSR